MAVNFVGGKIQTGANPQAAYTSTAGNLLVVGCYAFSTTATFTVTDSAGQTWTAGPVVTGTSHRHQLFYKENSAAVTFVKNTIVNSGGTPRITVAEFSGVQTSSALRNTKTNFGSSSNGSSGAYTVTVGDLVVAWGVPPPTPTEGAGFTSAAVLKDGGSCFEYQLAAAGTSVNAAFVHAFTEWSVTSMAFIPVAAAPPVPKTYYVSTTGSDANSGETTALAWAHAPGMTGATGLAASTVLLPGDTVRLKCGDTWSATTMTLNAGGTVGNPITLTSYSTGAKPIISATANSPALTVTVADRGYWTIDGLDLRASGLIAGINLPASLYHNYWAADMLPVPGWIIQNCVSNASFYVSGPNTTVRSCVLDGTTNSNPPFGGIIFRGEVNTGGLIELNEVHHFKDRGVWLFNGANNGVVRYNNVHDITLGADNEGMGINFDGFAIAVTGGQAYGNWIHACNGIGVTYENGTGGRCYYNLIHDCVQGGVDAINYASYQTLPSNIEFNYNVIYNTNVGIMILDAQGIKAIGNTLVNGTGANSFAFGIWTLDTNVQDLTFVNNIVGGVWTHPIQVRTTKDVWAEFDYNDIVPTGSEVVWQAGITTSQTLAQLQALGLMTHGITSNPQFVAGSGSSYAIAAGSPANASGINLGSTYQTALKPTTTWPTNIVTGAQASAWDMGAYLQSPTGTGGGDAGGGHGPSAYRIRKRRRENLERQMR